MRTPRLFSSLPLILLALSSLLVSTPLPAEAAPQQRTQAGSVIIFEYIICVVQHAGSGWGAPRECALTLRGAEGSSPATPSAGAGVPARR